MFTYMGGHGPYVTY